MSNLTAGFIGFGLIGGSIAKGLKRDNPRTKIMAYMRTVSKLEQAKRDGVVDLVVDGIDGRLSECDIIFLCTPVEFNADYLKKIRPLLKDGAFITDVGSTKLSIHEQVKELQMEDVFVGGHPMAGSEKTGYENATDHLLENAYYIITPTARSRKEDVERLTAVAGAIRAIPVVLDYREHDSIVAAVSHLPHLVASSLVNLVRENDTPGERMKQLAAGGFKDITRIASASPVMWEQICMTNRGPIADILEKYIASLQEVLEQVKSSDSDAIFRLFDESKTYRNSFADSGKGSVMPDYSFSVDILDEPGAISTISVILAAKGISIKNIGINHNRELGEGALRITFYQEKEMRAAWMYLQRHNYTLIKG